MEKAVKNALGSVFFNKGENCIAAGRLFIEETIYDEVQEANEQVTEVNDLVQEAIDEAEVVHKEHDDGNGFIDASKFVGCDYF